MSNARGKSIDHTHLSIDLAEERILIHRDYLGHCLRWTHVAKRLGTSARYKTSRVLDIGCGVDLPMPRMLYSNRFIPIAYVGLEYNSSHKLKTEPFENGKFPLAAYGGVDFTTWQVVMTKPGPDYGIEDNLCLKIEGDELMGEHRLPNVFVCFEMLEHVEPGHARATLVKMYHIMRASEMQWGSPTIAFISTPCYDSHVGAADNHVNEMRRDVLGSLLEDIGFGIQENYGVFASIRDYRDLLLEERPELRRLWEELHGYYDTNMLANILAPIVPHLARNNMWVIRPSWEGYERKFMPLGMVPTSHDWTSSDRWRELADPGIIREYGYRLVPETIEQT